MINTNSETRLLYLYYNLYFPSVWAWERHYVCTECYLCMKIASTRHSQSKFLWLPYSLWPKVICLIDPSENFILIEDTHLPYSNLLTNYWLFFFNFILFIYLFTYFIFDSIWVNVLVTQSCPTFCDTMRLLYSWNSPGKNPGVGCHFLLPGIFLTEVSNLALLYWKQILYHLRE